MNNNVSSHHESGWNCRIPESRQKSETRYFVVKESRLTAADIMKIIGIICGTAITSLLIVCAYKAGAMIMLVGIIGFLALVWIW